MTIFEVKYTLPKRPSIKELLELAHDYPALGPWLRQGLKQCPDDEENIGEYICAVQYLLAILMKKEQKLIGVL